MFSSPQVRKAIVTREFLFLPSISTILRFEIMSATLAHLKLLLGLDFPSKFFKVGCNLVANSISVGQFRPCSQDSVVFQEPPAFGFDFSDYLPRQILFPLLSCSIVLADVFLNQLSKHHISWMTHIRFTRTENHIVKRWTFNHVLSHPQSMTIAGTRRNGTYCAI